MLTARAATIEDIRGFYPDMTASVRAWVFELDNQVVGIIGVSLLRPIACAFSQFTPALEPYLGHPVIWRIVKKLQAAMAGLKMPVRAIVEPGVTDHRILQRVGFRYVGKIDGDQVYEYRGAC